MFGSGRSSLPWVERSVLSVEVNLAMRLVELEGGVPMKSRAGNVMLLQPSLSPITWEIHAWEEDE